MTTSHGPSSSMADSGRFKMSPGLGKKWRETMEPMVRGESKAGAAVREWLLSDPGYRSDMLLQYPELRAMVAAKLLRDAKGGE